MVRKILIVLVDEPDCHDIASTNYSCLIRIFRTHIRKNCRQTVNPVWRRPENKKIRDEERMTDVIDSCDPNVGAFFERVLLVLASVWR